MTERTAEQRQLLDELAEVSRREEELRTALWLLDQEHYRLRERLISSGWKPTESAHDT